MAQSRADMVLYQFLMPFSSELLSGFLKWKTFSADNPQCYSNNIVPCLYSFIGMKHGQAFNGYIYPNSQCAKGLVDSHFVVLKRWVDKYVRVFQIISSEQKNYYQPVLLQIEDFRDAGRRIMSDRLYHVIATQSRYTEDESRANQPKWKLWLHDRNSRSPKI